MISVSRLLVIFAMALVAPVFAADQPAPTVLVGTAKVDITPDLPIRLAGYQSRPTEAARVEQRLFARALAIGSDDQGPVVLVTVELVGMAEKMSDAVAAALRQNAPVDRAHVAICATHVHTGPSLSGVLPFMFSKDLPADEVARIEAYTAALQTKLVQVAAAALADRKPGRLAWGEGKADFAGQRRKIVNGKWTGFGYNPLGPVDHALPVLRVTDDRGRLRAVFVSYACHCTTLTGAENFVHPDWAGNAAERLEAGHPGAIALVALGCGGDANPEPRGLLEQVSRHGQTIATEVERLLAGSLRPLGPVTVASYRRIELELDHVVTREELQARMGNPKKQTIAYAASKFLLQLDAGHSLPAAVPYPVQAWRFGNDLAMVFLGGEVVSEYSLRLRRELDSTRLWVNAYANSVPCYVSSQRMFAEGGYEVEGSMDYYGWPTRLAIGTEDKIVETVRGQMPRAFVRAGGK